MSYNNQYKLFKSLSVLHLCLVFVLGLLITSRATAQASIHNQIQQLIRSTNIGNASVAVDIHDLKINASVISINEKRPMIPASNMKIITSAAALDILTPNFVFKTKLVEFENNLIVQADGDPAFGDPVILADMNMDVDDLLNAWAKVVRVRSDKQYDQLFIDDRIFDQNFVHKDWPENQLDKWYCAQVSGLSFNDNCLDIFAIPTVLGQSPRVNTRPVNTGFKFSNISVTGTKNAFWASRKPNTNDITFRGTLKHRLEYPINLTVHDPSMFFASSFNQSLLSAGVYISKKPARIPNDAIYTPQRTLAVVETKLAAVINRCNKVSQNLFAEALIKRVGYHTTSQPGSWSNGSATIRAWLSNKLGAVAGDARIADGSGMSRTNKLSARLITSVLKHMHNDPKLANIFINSLARPGQRGTLKSRFTDDNLTAEIYAKSGYLQHTITLSGYLVYEDRTLTFSILFNDFRKGPYYAKQLADKIIKQVDTYYTKQILPKATLGG